MRRRKKLIGLALLLIGSTAGYYFALPKNLFTTLYSYVLEDRNGNLLSATVARDGQWRFPPVKEVPDKFIKALIAFEDKRFFEHFGVDLLALGRAIRQNMQAGKIISGGSTLTMQVIRLSRNQSRTYIEKLIEIILATRLELSYSKDEILALYSAHAPFGGNVVGLEAAAWRYFGRSPEHLSWAEAATLAVLPNAPSLIHPGKNREALINKRNKLLHKLHAAGVMDEMELQLALEEPLPEKPSELPNIARHLLDRSKAENPSTYRIRSTLDGSLQHRAMQIATDHAQRLQVNKIHNVAVLIAEVNSGEVLAYVGNAVAHDATQHSPQVDIIRSPRSTGSILKPFLYAAMLDEGKILPGTLLPDIPVMINGFAPKNFSQTYDGAVPAGEVLVRSLNIPAVLMLREYRYEKFHNLLKQLGMTTLASSPNRYGLSLIVGGAEGTLWDLTGMYASMARVLNMALNTEPDKRYNASDYHPLYYIPVEQKENSRRGPKGYLSAASIYQTFEVLTELNRPGEERGWRSFSSTRKIAWKTGTSYGFRDAWAIGITPRYVVGVWVGNAGGEGRPGLTGVEAAAPVMFDVFSTLPGSSWFGKPYSEMQQVAVCKSSGMRMSDACTQADTLWINQRGLETVACTFHKWVHLSKDMKYRVHTACADAAQIVTVPWFVLPALQEHYFAKRKLLYRTLPPYRHDCQPAQSIAQMEWVYPKQGARLLIPRQLNGEPGMAVFELAHRHAEAEIYWHLDGEFLGITRKNHQIPVNPGPGTHFLQVFDNQGQELSCWFTVISSR
ncbi:MAG: penicillin-binding protein 1C [Cyclobacteriaceae bacterium]|nr:penicillin-binding protein 1C [Cyclobacteriaceae bacterium]